jgi:hypothetical protein
MISPATVFVEKERGKEPTDPLAGSAAPYRYLGLEDWALAVGKKYCEMRRTHKNRYARIRMVLPKSNC